MSLQDTKCRLCRREGRKLFLKGARCESQKCGVTRRSYAPGQHGQKAFMKSVSDFAKQLRAKQAAKRIYKLRETVLEKYYDIASKTKGSTAERLLQLLETRLDNTIYRLGFIDSRSTAQQLITHGHILVNNKKLDIPSYNVKPEDKISINAKIKPLLSKKTKETDIPLWLQLSKDGLTGKVLRIPAKEDINTDIDIQSIVEFYSR